MSGIWPGNTKCVAALSFDLDGITGAINRNPDAWKMPSLLSYREYVAVEVNVRPAQPEEFTFTHPCCQSDNIQRFEPVSLRSVEQSLSLFRRKGSEFLPLQSWWVNSFRRVDGHEAKAQSLPERAVNYGVHLPDRFRSKTLAEKVAVQS